MNVTLSELRTAGARGPEAARSDAGTRQRVLELIAADGPISAAEIAGELDLTSAGIRRHLGVLEGTEQIAVHEGG